MYKCGSRQPQGRYFTCTGRKNVWEYIFRQRKDWHSAYENMLDMYKCGSILIFCTEVPRVSQFVGLFDGSLFICIRRNWLICCTDTPREREYASLFVYVSFLIYTSLLTCLALSAIYTYIYIYISSRKRCVQRGEVVGWGRVPFSRI